MEQLDNENIQYRKLRDPKKGKVGKFSVSLLGKVQKDKHSQQKKKKDLYETNINIMKRNVMSYQHLLKNPLLHMKDVDWVSKLRQPYEQKDNKQDEVQFLVPSVFSKTTEARSKHLEKISNKERSFNTADFYQVISRKQNSAHLESGTLSYITNLRAYPNERKTQKPVQKQNQPQNKTLNKQNEPEKVKNRQKPAFSTIPYKERNQYPKFLTKSSLKKFKNITNKELESAFDGCQNYPIFNQKTNKQRNYGVFKTFTTGNCKSSFPTLAWQMGLRKF